MMLIKLSLPDALLADLHAESKVAGMKPEQFAAECVETVLASRRLEKLEPSKLGARVPE